MNYLKAVTCTKVRRGCVANLSQSFHDHLEDTKEQLKGYLIAYFEDTWRIIQLTYQKIITKPETCTSEDGDILQRKLKEQKEIIDKRQIASFLEGDIGEDCETRYLNFKHNYIAKQQASKCKEMSINRCYSCNYW